MLSSKGCTTLRIYHYKHLENSYLCSCPCMQFLAEDLCILLLEIHTGLGKSCHQKRTMALEGILHIPGCIPGPCLAPLLKTWRKYKKVWDCSMIKHYIQVLSTHYEHQVETFVAHDVLRVHNSMAPIPAHHITYIITHQSHNVCTGHNSAWMYEGCMSLMVPSIVTYVTWWLRIIWHPVLLHLQAHTYFNMWPGL